LNLDGPGSAGGTTVAPARKRLGLGGPARPGPRSHKIESPSPVGSGPISTGGGHQIMLPACARPGRWPRRVQSKPRGAADRRGPRRPVRGNSPQVARLRRPDRATYGELPAEAGGVSPRRVQSTARLRTDPWRSVQGNSPQVARLRCPDRATYGELPARGWRVGVASVGAEQGAGRGATPRSAAGVSPRRVQSKARARSDPRGPRPRGWGAGRVGAEQGVVTTATRGSVDREFPDQRGA